MAASKPRASGRKPTYASHARLRFRRRSDTAGRRVDPAAAEAFAIAPGPRAGWAPRNFAAPAPLQVPGPERSIRALHFGWRGRGQIRLRATPAAGECKVDIAR